MSNDEHIDDPDGALIDLSDPTDAPADATGTAAPQQADEKPAPDTAPQPAPKPEQSFIPQAQQRAAAPTHEARATPRYRARWRTEVTLNAQTTYYGHLKDISVEGAAVLMEHNIKSAQSVTLFIEIPSEHAQHPPHILQVESKVIDTIYEGESAFFRTSLSFRRFIPADDRIFLDNHLKNHCMPLG